MLVLWMSVVMLLYRPSWPSVKRRLLISRGRVDEYLMSGCLSLRHLVMSMTVSTVFGSIPLIWVVSVVICSVILHGTEDRNLYYSILHLPDNSYFR